MISYLLTSHKTSERFESTLNHLNQFGQKPFVFFGPENVSEKESNSLGHLNILNHFVDTAEDFCLVFEDDCLLLKEIPFDIILKNHFDFFLIGGIPKDTYHESENYSISKNFLQTHCYIISKKAAIEFINEANKVSEMGYIDHFMSNIFNEIYSLNPTIAKQNPKFKSKIPKK